MGVDQIQSRYHGLREELEAAYSHPEWDSGRIDAIAEELSQLERRLASAQSATGASTVA